MTPEQKRLSEQYPEAFAAGVAVERARYAAFGPPSDMAEANRLIAEIEALDFGDRVAFHFDKMRKGGVSW